MTRHEGQNGNREQGNFGHDEITILVLITQSLFATLHYALAALSLLGEPSFTPLLFKSYLSSLEAISLPYLLKTDEPKSGCPNPSESSLDIQSLRQFREQTKDSSRWALPGL